MDCLHSGHSIRAMFILLPGSTNGLDGVFNAAPICGYDTTDVHAKRARVTAAHHPPGGLIDWFCLPTHLPD